jgi:hypothetical protein
LGIVYSKEPELTNPVLVASWPGIGNVGILAVDTLRAQLQAEEFAQIEPWEFFYPSKVTIRGGLLEDLEFPASTFYFKKLPDRDLIIFMGEDQPVSGARVYAEGRKAYAMANLVLDVAERYGCRRIYTSGAAVSLIHHTARPRVWGVASSKALNKEVRSCPNTVLMGEIEGHNEPGAITGLNGLLLGVARKRGLEAVCLMGEVPDYLAGAPFPSPRASRSVLEVLTGMLGVSIDLAGLDEVAGQVDAVINGLYDRLPPELKERVEQRKTTTTTAGEQITEEEERWMKEHIDELFPREGGNERPPQA